MPGWSTSTPATPCGLAVPECSLSSRRPDSALVRMGGHPLLFSRWLATAAAASASTAVEDLLLPGKHNFLLVLRLAAHCACCVSMPAACHWCYGDCMSPG
jgi:hypothetical protein